MSALTSTPSSGCARSRPGPSILLTDLHLRTRSPRWTGTSATVSERQEQVLAAVAAGARTAGEIADRVYGAALEPACAASPSRPCARMFSTCARPAG
jgi:hypothetical protein